MLLSYRQTAEMGAKSQIFNLMNLAPFTKYFKITVCLCLQFLVSNALSLHNGALWWLVTLRNDAVVRQDSLGCMHRRPLATNFPRFNSGRDEPLMIAYDSLVDIHIMLYICSGPEFIISRSINTPRSHALEVDAAPSGHITSSSSCRLWR